MSLRPSRLVPDRLRLPAILVAAVTFIAGGVWIASYAQRSASDQAAAQSRGAQLMLTGMLDQETGLRGYVLNGRSVFLEPYTSGRRTFARALARSRALSAGDGDAGELIDRQADTVREWQALAERELRGAGRKGFQRRDVNAALVRKATMDRFRALNADFQALIESRRADEIRDAGFVAVAVTLGLSAIFGAFGGVVIGRGRRRREQEREFAESLPVMRSESEAHELLRSHVERSVEGGHVTVLTRNNSADRLVPATALDESDPLAEPLEQARPGSCMAVRLARPHQRSAASEPLLSCELCGAADRASACQPLLVGGEVLGSVLLRKSDSHVSPLDRERLAEAVSRAAPALANLRNLALAETRAQTDALTGLANKRAIEDTVKRLHAHASRTGTRLSVIVADLDHFKRINDTHGHDRGDHALAAAAGALSATVRASDFVGRMGGEEFIVLLPGTSPDGACSVAEKLRQAIEALHLPGVHDGLSASFGVATYPDDATEPDAVLRLADRALYLAKKLGRNRVEGAAGADLPLEPAPPAATTWPA